MLRKKKETNKVTPTKKTPTKPTTKSKPITKTNTKNKFANIYEKYANESVSIKNTPFTYLDIKSIILIYKKFCNRKYAIFFQIFFIETFIYYVNQHNITVLFSMYFLKL